jgi:hypothetical protein
LCFLFCKSLSLQKVLIAKNVCTVNITVFLFLLILKLQLIKSKNAQIRLWQQLGEKGYQNMPQSEVSQKANRYIWSTPWKPLWAALTVAPGLLSHR